MNEAPALTVESRRFVVARSRALARRMRALLCRIAGRARLLYSHALLKFSDDEAVASEAPFEDFGALFGGERALDRVLRAVFAEEGYAAAAARAADLRGERAAPQRGLGEALHARRGVVGPRS